VKCGLNRLLAALAFFVLVAGTLATAGCARTAPPPATDQASVKPDEPRDGGTLRYGIREPFTLWPGDLRDEDGMQVAQAIFDSLTQIDSLDPELVLPSAAETWSVNADATVWTFKLDRDRKFHEGTPVTAADFAYAWNRIARESALDASLTTSTPPARPAALALIVGWDAVRAGVTPVMAGVDALDDVTLRVTLSRPYADFGYAVADPSLAPLPEKYVEQGVEYEGEKVPFSEMPVGNGPFKMAAPWKHGRQIKVVRNADYRGAMAHIDAVDFLVSRDATASFAAFQRGKLDFTRVPRSELATAVLEYGESAAGYVANPHRQVLRGAENTVSFLLFNLRDQRLRDPALRRAVSLALNRKAVCESVYRGSRLPADNAVPPGVAGYLESGWADARYDVVAASAALREVTPGKGRALPRLALSYESAPDSDATAKAIQSDLAAIGIGVDLVPVEPRLYESQLRAGGYQLALATRSAASPTIDASLDPLFDSGSKENLSGFSSDPFDRGIVTARATVPWSARMSRYLELNYVVQRENPIAPIAFHRHHHVASDRVHDLIHSAENRTDFARVWLDEPDE